MEQKGVLLGWQDLEELKNTGRVLEAFVILVNWFERNLQFPIYYYYIISKNDEHKKKEFLKKFENWKGKESRLLHKDLIDILNKEQSEQELIKIWIVITRFWNNEDVWKEFKIILRKIGEEFEIKDIDKLIQEIYDFREMRGKVIHRLVEDRLTDKEIEEYYEIGKKLNEKVKQLHFKFLNSKDKN